MPDIVILYLSFWIFILGLCIGSFLNVVIIRELSNQSIIFPASNCPHCQNTLKWWHNIPLISYLILNGKCYFCHGKISPQYFIIELLTGILFLITFLKFGLTINTLFYLIFIALFIIMSGTDIKEKIIFDKHLIILLIFSLIYSFLNNHFINSLIGMVIGFIIFEILSYTSYPFIKSRAFGIGDTYIVAILGIIFGWKNLLITLLGAIIIQTFISLPLYLYKQIKNKNFKILFSLLLFCLCIFIQKITCPTNNLYILYTNLALILITGIYLIIQIIKNINSKSSVMLLPFAPALFLSAIIILFLN